MLELISEIGSSLIQNLVFLIVGCLISVVISIYWSGRLIKYQGNLVKDILFIAVFSLAGMLLPLGTYGLIVPAAVLILLGARMYIILPMVISNLLFNMLVPYTDITFVWRTGMLRVAFAFIAAFITGILLRLLKCNNEKLLDFKNIILLDKKPASIRDVISFIGENIGKLGVYMIIGVIVNTVFHKYVWWDILDILFANPYTSGIARYFTTLNVVNPVFLVAMNIVFLLMDFVKLSALLAILRIRGFITYFVYFIVWTVLLSLSAFI